MTGYLRCIQFFDENNATLIRCIMQETSILQETVETIFMCSAHDQTHSHEISSGLCYKKLFYIC